MFSFRLDLTEASRLAIRPGETWRLRVTCQNPDKTPYDFNGCNASAVLLDATGATVRAFTVAFMPLGVLDVSMQTAGLTATKTATWRVQVTYPNGDIHYLIEGVAHVGGFKP
jgi:hypothetical protein